MKDWAILLIKNTQGTWVERAYWWAIRKATGSDFNHAQLVRDFGGTLWICESTAGGFHITKPLSKWWEEQATKKRVFKEVYAGIGSEAKFREILDNQYDAKYWTYLTRRYSSMQSSNCFQSIAYIFGVHKYWVATANTLLQLGVKS